MPSNFKFSVLIPALHKCNFNVVPNNIRHTVLSLAVLCNTNKVNVYVHYADTRKINIHTIAQVVRFQSFTTQAMVQSQASPCGICGRQSYLGTEPPGSPLLGRGDSRSIPGTRTLFVNCHRPPGPLNPGQWNSWERSQVA